MPTIIHQTPEQFAARLNAACEVAKGDRLAQLSVAAVNLIDSGVITEAQMRNAFGLSVADWAKRKSEMVALRSAAQLIKSAGGK